MAILVTGGAGYIGSHLVHALSDLGEQAVVIDDLSAGFRKLLPPDIPLYVGNCRNPELVSNVLRKHAVSAIVHLAGSVLASESVANPSLYFENNVDTTRALIDVAIDHGVNQFVYSSTAAVYGQPSQIPVDETAQTHPVSPYGQSKLDGEKLLQVAAVSHGLKSVILRIFNVAGADPRLRTGQSGPASSHLIRIAVQTAIGVRPEMEVYGIDYATRDGTCIRDYTHVSDIVRAYVEAVYYLRAGGEPLILNCGSGEGVSVYEVIQAVKRVSGSDFRLVQRPRRAGDPSLIVASAERAGAVLGWHTQIGHLDEIVRHALAWESKLKTQFL